MRKVVEGKVSVVVGEARRRSVVFYNELAASQRDINVALLNALDVSRLRVADALGGSGVRSARFLAELPRSKIKQVHINDANPSAVKLIRRNLKKYGKHKVYNQDASLFLHSTGPYDYIDIDPFGSPAPYLDSACKMLTKKGVLALTATDTAALSGTSIAACMRKYWSRSLKNEFMHETGLRILVRKAQLVAAQYDKMLVPVYCHSYAHYMRVYLQFVSKAKDVFKEHRFVHYCFRCLDRFVEWHNSPKKCCGAPMSVAGPLWTGSLWDSKLAQKLAFDKFTNIIAEESKIPSVGFFDIHRVAKKHKRVVPKTQLLLDRLGENGFKAVVSHFSATGVRTDATLSALLKHY